MFFSIYRRLPGSRNIHRLIWRDFLTPDTCYLTPLNQVVIGEESINSVRRYKRQVSKDGIFLDMEHLRHFESPPTAWFALFQEV